MTPPNNRPPPSPDPEGPLTSRFPDLLDQLAAKTPAPGGGAAAGMAGAIAAALGEMVAAYSLRDEAPGFAATAEALAAARSGLMVAARDDADAYARYTEARRYAKSAGIDPKAADRVLLAAQHCVDVPLRMLTACLDVLECLHRDARAVKPVIASDQAIAGALAEAAAASAAWTALINTPLLTHPETRAAKEAQARAGLARARELRDAISAATAPR
ncbi:MAG: cyclodeaminase/cyclohydrolase family protein [Planctomycetota bacterium]